MISNMKDFYTKAGSIIQAQVELQAAHRTRKAEIMESTANESQKAADLAAENGTFQSGTKAHEGMMLKLVAEARSHVEQALATWKNASNPALTNVLLALNTASQNKTGFPVAMLEKVVQSFIDDPISIDVIRQAATAAGVQDSVLARIRSDYGTAPLQTLEAFEKKAPIAFTQGNDFAFGELVRATVKGAAGEDVVMIPSAGMML